MMYKPLNKSFRNPTSVNGHKNPENIARYTQFVKRYGSDQLISECNEWI